MPSVTSHHPSPDELVRYGQGRLDQAHASLIEEHVASCDSCCETLRRVPDDTLIGRIRPAETVAFHEPSAPPSASSAGLDTLPEELRDHPRYRIVKLLGAGGMGVVYKAEHRVMERHVALKVINQRLIRNQVALDRFHREAKAAARPSHPAIVTAYDADQAGSLQILVMEYVDGISIARQVEKLGTMAVRHACQFARQAALGLQHAHAKGMIHRDIKPQNLMLTRDARVKILDFGLARYAREADLPGSGAREASPDDARQDARLTQDGVTLGTPDYIAPEQIRGAATVDIRADIYSLGCTLFFMLVGRPPFPHGTAAEKLLAHMECEPPDLATLRPDVPPALAAVIGRMMAKDPADRFATPGEVAEALVPFLKAPAPAQADGEASPALSMNDLANSFPLGLSAPGTRVHRQPKRRRSLGRFALPLVVAGGLIVSLLAWIVFGPRQPDEPRRPSQPTTAARTPSVGASATASMGRPGSGFPVTKPAHSHWSGKQHSPAIPALPGGRVPRILLVVPHDNFWIPDVVNVRRAAEKLGAKLLIASSEKTPAQPSSGGPPGQAEKVDMLLEEAKASDFDSVIFTGANPSESLDHLDDSRYADSARCMIEAFQSQGKPVGSICVGSRVLADLGFLKGRSASRCPYQPKTSEYEAKACWTDKPVQADGVFITGRDQDTAALLMREILTRIK